MTEAERATRDRSWVRLDGVDILRGLAILFVLMNHVNMRLFIAHVPYTRGIPEQLAASLVWNGQHGVQMFFAVSGFLITSTTLRRWGARSSSSGSGRSRRPTEPTVSAPKPLTVAWSSWFRWASVRWFAKCR